MKNLLPLINLALAAGLFFSFTDKMMVNAPLNEKVMDAATGRVDITKSAGGIRELVKRQKELNKALAMAEEVSAKKNELSLTYNSFSDEELSRLNELLPDHIDNIHLIIDVNGIAKKNGMAIKNIDVSTSADVASRDKMIETTSLDPRLGMMKLSFSVTGTYEMYKKFVGDLATSLRIIDMSSVSFATDDKGIYTYDIVLKTYWLK